MKKRILLLEFRQETNTFNPIVAGRSEFNAGTPAEGAQVFHHRMNTNSAVRGAADAFGDDAEFIPSVFMSAPSGGRVADSVFEEMLKRLEYYVRNNTFDAICASLHGATCSETTSDVCGTILERLRALAGDKPIAASFDMHANITDKVLQNTDILCGYQTYPHRDQYNAGYRSGKLCKLLLEGKRFYTAAAAIPMLIPPAGYTSDDGPFADLINQANALVADGTLMDYTVFAVQPWLDIPEITSRVITVAEDPDTAKKAANELAQKLSDLRQQVQPALLSVDEIIDIAEKNDTGKPVILSEFADSPNGGCVGDSPVVALRLLERGSKLRAGLFVRDPEAVQEAFRLGVGGKGMFRVGAAFTPGMPGPLVAEGTVCSLHDGRFILEGPAMRNTIGYVGPCAVIRFGTVDILVCTCNSNSGDPQIFRHFGIEPSLYDLIVVKANTSFRLPYSKISPLIYCADTPGAGAANLKQLYWNKLPQGLFPFVEDIVPTEAKIV